MSGRLREAWREWRGGILLLLTIATLALGVAGFDQLGDGMSTSLYRSVQLFGLGGPSGDVPWELDIARLVAPLIIGVATVTALLGIFREQAGSLRLRRLRGHVVVIGFGTVGSRLASALRDQGRRVVGIEIDPQAPLLASARERRIPIVVGDAGDGRIQRRAGVDRAAQVVIACGDDATNLDALAEARGLAAGRSAGGPLACAVNLDDRRLWRLLRSEEVGDPAEVRSARVDYFSVRGYAAGLLQLRHAPPRPDLLVVGASPLIRAAVVQLAGRWREAFPERGTVTIAELPGDDETSQFRAEHPELEAAAEFERLELPSRGALEHLAGRRWSAAFIDCESESESLAAATALAAAGAVDGEIVIVVSDSQAGASRAVEAFTGRLSQIKTFGVYTEALGVPLLSGMVGELLARAKHEQYLESERQRGHRPAETDSSVPWEELDETYKRENRAFADSIGAKLEALGMAVVPARGNGAPSRLELDASVLEELARAEHDRWAASRTADGWRASDAKDAQRKTHPSLVDWESLSEEDRERDREPIRQLPEILAGAGLEIVSRDRAADDDAR
jgi:hypothetical protein